jgi:hypothetical protein
MAIYPGVKHQSRRNQRKQIREQRNQQQPATVQSEKLSQPPKVDSRKSQGYFSLFDNLVNLLNGVNGSHNRLANGGEGSSKGNNKVAQVQSSSNQGTEISTYGKLKASQLGPTENISNKLAGKQAAKATNTSELEAETAELGNQLLEEQETLKQIIYSTTNAIVELSNESRTILDSKHYSSEQKKQFIDAQQVKLDQITKGYAELQSIQVELTEIIEAEVPNSKNASQFYGDYKFYLDSSLEKIAELKERKESYIKLVFQTLGDANVLCLRLQKEASNEQKEASRGVQP